MAQSSTPNETKEARERRKKQKEFQNKKARMASYWRTWEEFNKQISADPLYERAIYKIVAEISQMVALAKNTGKYVLEWSEARDKVMNFDRKERLSKQFEKTFRSISYDVSRLASHASWMSGVARRGDYGILADVIRELRECSGNFPPQAMAPREPVFMKAAEINAAVVKANQDFQKIEKEFLGEKPKKSGTDTFPFLEEVDRQARFFERRRKRPRKNWRKEIGQ